MTKQRAVFYDEGCSVQHMCFGRFFSCPAKAVGLVVVFVLFLLN